MGNGTLVFIIILEAIVIIWQASKLSQYSKLDKLLSNRDKLDGNVVESSAKQSGSSGVASATASSAMARQASQSVASSLNAEQDDSVLDTAGVDPEGNIEEAKRVQLVMARCRYAEFYLEQLDDDYEREQFQRIVNTCKKTARSISDPFFRSSALQPLIVLLDKAEWAQERDQLLTEVDDELIRQQLSSSMSIESS